MRVRLLIFMMLPFLLECAHNRYFVSRKDLEKITSNTVTLITDEGQRKEEITAITLYPNNVRISQKVLKDYLAQEWIKGAEIQGEKITKPYWVGGLIGAGVLLVISSVIFAARYDHHFQWGQGIVGIAVSGIGGFMLGYAIGAATVRPYFGPAQVKEE